MRKWTLGLMAVIIVSMAGIVLAAAWKAQSDSAIDVTRQMMRALEKRDMGDLQRAFCHPDLGALVLSASKSGVRFSDLRYAEAPHPTGGITVAISGHMAASGTSDAVIQWSARLHQSGGIWCVLGLNSGPN